jgi:hypothetical protein
VPFAASSPKWVGDLAGASTVGDLDAAVLVELAPRLWVTLPG